MAGPKGLTTEQFVEKVAWRLNRYIAAQEEEEGDIPAEVVSPSLKFRRNYANIDSGKLKELFEEFDSDKSGKLTLDEVLTRTCTHAHATHTHATHTHAHTHMHIHTCTYTHVHTSLLSSSSHYNIPFTHIDIHLTPSPSLFSPLLLPSQVETMLVKLGVAPLKAPEKRGSASSDKKSVDVDSHQ